jgi:hypothetical protein
MGGLEGRWPSKKYPFLVVVADEAGNDHQKNGDLGEARSLPEPLTA